MNDLKIGDVVVFFTDGHHPPKEGQIIDIFSEDCDVYVSKESAVYRVKKEKCKKIV